MPVLLFFLVLSAALSWPTLLHFTTHIVGQGRADDWPFDPLHNLWMLWHTREALLGNHAMFYAHGLYYPHGISLLTHGLGPVMGFFALPFWLFGSAAAHNGAVLVGLSLTGYFTYLLARGLHIDRGSALFAGTLVMVSAPCLVGLYGHMTKIFLGAMALTLLTFHHALDLQRSRWWTVAVGLALLVTLLHSGYHFVFTGLAMAFFAAAVLLAATWAERGRLVIRLALVGLSILLLVGPLLSAILKVSADPALHIEANSLAPRHPTELTMFFLPNHLSVLFGGITRSAMRTYEINSLFDGAIAVSWPGMLLCLVVAFRGNKLMRHWLIFTCLFLVLALGTTLQVLGKDTFTEYELPIILPYAFLTGIPGLDFMRVPSRFVMLSVIGLAITAGFGLSLIVQRWPHRKHWIVGIAIVLVLLENWPRPWTQSELPPVPEFYQQLARDPDHYGVFDLPISQITPRTTVYIQPSALYQFQQITHSKGIASGYLSRTFYRHPVFPDLMNFTETFADATYYPDIRINGQAIGSHAYVQQTLAAQNYRYVVWHKMIYPNTEGDEAAQTFLEAVFGGQPPLVDDDLVRVYELLPPQPVTDIELGQNWSQREPDWRWATSPVTLSLTSVQTQSAALQITPAMIHNQAAENGLGSTGVLDVRTNNGLAVSVPITVENTTTVPLKLPTGTEIITLALQAGNFQPAHLNGSDNRTLSFAIRTLNVALPEQPYQGRIAPSAETR
jgi:hypothetical protein